MLRDVSWTTIVHELRLISGTNKSHTWKSAQSTLVALDGIKTEGRVGTLRDAQLRVIKSEGEQLDVIQCGSDSRPLLDEVSSQVTPFLDALPEGKGYGRARMAVVASRPWVLWPASDRRLRSGYSFEWREWQRTTVAARAHVITNPCNRPKSKTRLTSPA